MTVYQANLRGFRVGAEGDELSLPRRPRGQPRTIFLAFLEEIPETTVITVTKYLRTPLKEIRRLVTALE